MPNTQSVKVSRNHYLLGSAAALSILLLYLYLLAGQLKVSISVDELKQSFPPIDLQFIKGISELHGQFSNTNNSSLIRIDVEGIFNGRNFQGRYLTNRRAGTDMHSPCEFVSILKGRQDIIHLTFNQFTIQSGDFSKYEAMNCLADLLIYLPVLITTHNRNEDESQKQEDIRRKNSSTFDQ